MKYFLSLLLISCAGLNAVNAIHAVPVLVDQKKFVQLLQDELDDLKKIRLGVDEDEIYSLDYFFMLGQERGIDSVYKIFRKCVIQSDDQLTIEMCYPPTLLFHDNQE